MLTRCAYYEARRKYIRAWNKGDLYSMRYWHDVCAYLYETMYGYQEF